MAEIILPKTGLSKQSAGDLGWNQKLDDSLQRLEDRTGLNGAGDPNGSRVGSWHGQTYFDTQSGVLYDCVRPGPAAGSARALWEPSSPVPPGQLAMFLRAEVPLGWLPMSGTYAKSAYPRLAAVLPPGLKQSATHFTLGESDEGNSAFNQGIIFRMIGGSTNGQILDEFNLTGVGPGGPTNCVLWDMLMGVKF